uniref:Uncharacterized protein n=1 Tax=Mycena chlorophos TaxID=658473 RepID=A0ABQ0M6X5_MYCCL|nr:predicted protein [Mycena chlorophos]
MSWMDWHRLLLGPSWESSNDLSVDNYRERETFAPVTRQRSPMGHGAVAGAGEGTSLVFASSAQATHPHTNSSFCGLGNGIRVLLRRLPDQREDARWRIRRMEDELHEWLQFRAARLVEGPQIAESITLVLRCFTTAVTLSGPAASPPRRLSNPVLPFGKGLPRSAPRLAVAPTHHLSQWLSLARHRCILRTHRQLIRAPLVAETSSSSLKLLDERVWIDHGASGRHCDHRMHAIRGGLPRLSGVCVHRVDGAETRLLGECTMPSLPFPPSFASATRIAFLSWVPTFAPRWVPMSGRSFGTQTCGGLSSWSPRSAGQQTRRSRMARKEGARGYNERTESVNGVLVLVELGSRGRTRAWVANGAFLVCRSPPDAFLSSAFRAHTIPKIDHTIHFSFVAISVSVLAWIRHICLLAPPSLPFFVLDIQWISSYLRYFLYSFTLRTYLTVELAAFETPISSAGSLARDLRFLHLVLHNRRYNF